LWLHRRAHAAPLAVFRRRRLSVLDRGEAADYRGRIEPMRSIAVAVGSLPMREPAAACHFYLTNETLHPHSPDGETPMVASARCLCALPAFLLVLGNCPAADEPSWRVKVGRVGKPATALVEMKARAAYGSAFCIHPSGLFLTNAHVVESPFDFPPNVTSPPVEINLVLNPGQKAEKTYPAKVVRSHRELDLALLRIDGVEDLPALALGSDEKLNELEEVVACGFPFGVALGRGRKEYPAVSINAGSITSLRRQGDRLQRIQVDVVLNPGNSGGPVLDREGKVVGVVVAGVPGSGVNFVIPVSHVAEFIARPDVQFAAPPLDAANFDKPLTFEARVVPLLPSTAPLTVELRLKPARGGKERTFRMEASEGKFRATAVPLPLPPGPRPLRLLARFDDSGLNATLTDRAFKVGERELKLSEVRSIQLRPAPRVVLHEGKEIEEPVTGLDAVSLRLGGQSVPVDLGQAVEMKVAPAAEADLLWYTLRVRQGDREVLRQSESLAIAGLLRPPFTDLRPLDIRPPSPRPGREDPVHAVRQVRAARTGGTPERAGKRQPDAPCLPGRSVPEPSGTRAGRRGDRREARQGQAVGHPPRPGIADAGGGQHQTRPDVRQARPPRPRGPAGHHPPRLERPPGPPSLRRLGVDQMRSDEDVLHDGLG
jgi:hypothetical protein